MGTMELTRELELDRATRGPRVALGVSPLGDVGQTRGCCQERERSRGLARECPLRQSPDPGGMFLPAHPASAALRRTPMPPTSPARGTQEPLPLEESGSILNGQQGGRCSDSQACRKLEHHPDPSRN